MRTYKATAEYTINAIRTLPVVIPDYGTIPGFIFHNTKDADEAIWDDSQHFPMGTSFLKLGVAGVADTAMEKAKSASCDESKELYLAIYDVYTETLSYLKKYPSKLSEMISSAEDPVEKERLNIMLLDINDIISGKPSSFRSAVTLFFIMYRIRNFFRCSTLGRLDVYFREFFENDIALGKITEEDALSIICNLWERINECGSGDTLMNVMVGGSDENGRDNSSRLSVLMLRASIMIPKSEPHINVRYHKGIRGDVMEEAYKLQATGRGQASIYNDDVIIPSLINHGIELKYACQYTNDGCTEIVFDGLSKIDFNHADIVAILDLTLNNGKFTPKNNIKIKYYCEASNPRESLPDAVPGIESGNIDDSTSFDEVYEAFLKQYKAQLEILMDAMNEKCHKYGTFPSVCGNPFLNGTFMSVLESGKNMYGGGLPVNCYMTFCGSIPTAADCLIAIKHIIFNKKICTISELKKALASNFEGYEELRRELKSAPKFGNDYDEPDLLAADIANHACDAFDEYYERTGFRIAPAFVGWKFLDEAYGIGATPDGRKQGDPIAEHYCATPGCAVLGPTALINSIAKGPLSRAYGVAAAHISLPSSVQDTESNGVSLMRALVGASINKGLPMINIAIYDVDSMLEAQKHPEEYQDLIVRVWGFSARFIDLSREMQDHVIKRTLSEK